MSKWEKRVVRAPTIGTRKMIIPAQPKALSGSLLALMKQVLYPDAAEHLSSDGQSFINTRSVNQQERCRAHTFAWARVAYLD